MVDINLFYGTIVLLNLLVSTYSCKCVKIISFLSIFAYFLMQRKASKSFVLFLAFVFVINIVCQHKNNIFVLKSKRQVLCWKILPIKTLEKWFISPRMALISSESGSWWFMIIFMAFCWFANSKKMWKYLHSFTQQFGVMMNDLLTLRWKPV